MMYDFREGVDGIHRLELALGRKEDSDTSIVQCILFAIGSNASHVQTVKVNLGNIGAVT